MPYPRRTEQSATQAAGALVGRERELGELVTELAAARAGHGSLFLLAGEPGVGKTRLSDAVAAQAEADGALALWGRCWEGGGAPAYWPWVQILRTLAREADIGSLIERMGSAAPRVARLIPELEPRFPAADAAGPEGEGERFAFFDAVTMLLRDAARERSLILVLDDLHAADEPSLHLLEFLARELRGARILVVGTYRTLEGAPGVRELLGRIAREARLIPLGGLSAEALERFVGQRIGSAPSAALVETLHEATDGNPFFLDEVVRQLQAEGALERGAPIAATELPLPDGVREAIRRRLEPLRPEALAVLQVAAGIGKEFELTPLELGCELPRDRVLELLDEALACGVVAEAREAIGRYRFAHALVREVLYDDLPALARVDLHQRIGRALERLYGGDAEQHLAELAHHFLKAAPTDYLGKAIEYATRAGERAMAVLAFEEAADHFDRALRALAVREPADPEGRCDLLIAMGWARRRAGDVESAREAFTRAAEVADQLQDATRLADAALGYAGRHWTAGVVDPSVVAMIERALAALGPDGGLPRARLLGRLATELYYGADRGRPAALSEEAVALARAAGDPAALATVLEDRLAATWGPDNLEERLALATEIVGLAETAGDRETAMRGRAFRVSCLFEIADLPEAESELAIVSRMAETLRQPLFLWHARLLLALRALSEGRWEEADRYAAAALEAGRRIDEGNALQFYLIQHLHISRYHDADIEHTTGPVQDLIERFPALPAWRIVLAYAYLHLERLDDVRREFESAAARDWTDLPRDSTWLLALSTAANVCAVLGDAVRARRLYDLLAPYAGRCVLLGRVATLSAGAVDRYLGQLAAVLGRHEDAARHFEAALEINGRMRAHPWNAQTMLEYGRMLVETGDAARGRELIEQARQTAEALGMPRVARWAAEAAPVATPAPARADRALFERRDDVWAIGREDAPHLVRDVKGLHYIAELLRHPGVELAAADLVAGAEGVPAAPAGDAGPALDPEAKAAYRARVEDLRETIEEAERWGDHERASRAREELEFLAHEISAAVGLGGRDRRAASDVERARVNVTRAIRSAVQRIAAADADLGHHLATAVRTGTFCSYVPDPRAPLEWLFTRPDTPASA